MTYCCITVANHGLSRLIRLVSRFTAHLCKKFCKQTSFSTLCMCRNIRCDDFFYVYGVYGVGSKIDLPISGTYCNDVFFTLLIFRAICAVIEVSSTHRQKRGEMQKLRSFFLTKKYVHFSCKVVTSKMCHQLLNCINSFFVRLTYTCTKEFGTTCLVREIFWV